MGVLPNGGVVTVRTAADTTDYGFRLSAWAQWQQVAAAAQGNQG
jgi:hypothetical protein